MHGKESIEGDENKAWARVKGEEGRGGRASQPGFRMDINARGDVDCSEEGRDLSMG